MSANPSEIHARGADRTAAGRRGSDGQEKTPDPKVLEPKIDKLVKLYEAAEVAKDALSEAVKKAAESSGFNAAALKKFVKARAGGEDEFADRKRDAEQLVLLFDKVGE